MGLELEESFEFDKDGGLVLTLSASGGKNVDDRFLKVGQTQILDKQTNKVWQYMSVDGVNWYAGMNCADKRISGLHLPTREELESLGIDGKFPTLEELEAIIGFKNVKKPTCWTSETIGNDLAYAVNLNTGIAYPSYKCDVNSVILVDDLYK